MFKNDNNIPESGTFKWVYAFITDVNYKSTYCAEVKYEIDVMQTFHFSYTLGACLVEREHSLTDGIGDNIIDEGLPVGDYEYTEMREFGANEYDISPAFVQTRHNQEIVIACTFDSNYTDSAGGVYGGYFSGLTFHHFPNTPTGRASCLNFIANAGYQVNGIEAIFLAPTFFITMMFDNSYFSNDNVPSFTHKLIYNDAYQTFDGYTPKNNKMFTYPYNYLYVYNSSNGVAEYKFEKFNPSPTSGSPFAFRFDEFLDFSCAPSLCIIPKNYENIEANYVESFTCGPFPQVAWKSDSYKAWISQNGQSYLIRSIGNTINLELGGTAQGVNDAYSAYQNANSTGQFAEMGIISGINQALGKFRGITSMFTSLLSDVSQAKHVPDQMHGNVNSPQLLCSIGEFGFHAYRRHARKDYAISIDNYFTMFGYKTNKIKVPNRTSRPHFNFTKTVNCLLTDCKVPSVYADKIKAIYDNGIRFWKQANEIGNYNLDNSPV